MGIEWTSEGRGGTEQSKKSSRYEHRSTFSELTVRSEEPTKKLAALYRNIIDASHKFSNVIV